MKKLKTTVADMVGNARKEIVEIETADLIGRLENPDTVIVDLSLIHI